MKVTTAPRRPAASRRVGPAFLPLLCAALLLTAVTWAYLPVGVAEFVSLDDPDYVAKNPVVLRGLTREGVRWAFTSFFAANWHPLTWLSHMLDVSLFGLEAGAHHLVSLGFHAANTVLLFLLLRRVTGALCASAAVAAVFGLHPVQVESVAWVAERKNVLSGLFFLLTLLAYARYVSRPGAGRYAAVAALFALGLLAKPMLVTVPLVLLLVDYWPLGRWGARPVRRGRRGSGGGAVLRPLVLEKVPLLALSLASGILTIRAQAGSGAVASLTTFSLPVRAGNALLGYCTYLGDLVLPRRLTVIYPHPGAALPAWKAVAAGALLGGLTLLAARARRTAPHAAAGWAWYVVTLLPVIGLIQVGSQARADRYLYLSMVGILVAVAWTAGGAVRARPRTRAAAAALAAAICVVLAVAARRQTGCWKDARTLLDHAVAAEPQAWLALTSLGNLLAQEGRYAEALAQFEASLRAWPESSLTHYRQALVLERLDRTDQALAHYREAVRIQPAYAQARNNLAALLLDLGRVDEALGQAREAVRLGRANALAHNNLANALARAGDAAGAERHYREAVRLEPLDAELRCNLGSFLAAQRRWVEAEEAFRRSLRLDPRMTAALNNLGAVLMLTGRSAEARRLFEEAVRLDPGNPTARENLRRLGSLGAAGTAEGN